MPCKTVRDSLLGAKTVLEIGAAESAVSPKGTPCHSQKHDFPIFLAISMGILYNEGYIINYCSYSFIKWREVGCGGVTN